MKRKQEQQDDAAAARRMLQGSSGDVAATQYSHSFFDDASGELLTHVFTFIDFYERCKNVRRVSRRFKTTVDALPLGVETLRIRIFSIRRPLLVAHSRCHWEPESYSMDIVYFVPPNQFVENVQLVVSGLKFLRPSKHLSLNVDSPEAIESPLVQHVAAQMIKPELITELSLGGLTADAVAAASQSFPCVTKLTLYDPRSLLGNLLPPLVSWTSLLEIELEMTNCMVPGGEDHGDPDADVDYEELTTEELHSIGRPLSMLSSLPNLSKLVLTIDTDCYLAEYAGDGILHGLSAVHQLQSLHFDFMCENIALFGEMLPRLVHLEELSHPRFFCPSNQSIWDTVKRTTGVETTPVKKLGLTLVVEESKQDHFLSAFADAWVEIFPLLTHVHLWIEIEPHKLGWINGPGFVEPQLQ